MFTQRHYITIAKTLRYDVLPNYNNMADYSALVETFSTMFARDNTKFKPDMFREACGIR